MRGDRSWRAPSSASAMLRVNKFLLGSSSDLLCLSPCRLEMSAEIIRQKELENLHRQRLLAGDPLSLHPGLPPDHPALRNVHDIPEGHPLREELSRRNAMLVLRHNNAPLLSLNPGVPSSATPPKEQPRRGSRKAAQHRTEPQGLSEAKEAAEPRGARDGAPDCNDEEMKDSESDADVSDEKPESLKAESSGSAAELKECKEAGKGCEGAKELGEGAAGTNAPCSSSSAESPSHLLGPGINKSEVKYLPPASIPPPQPLPFGFPYTMSPYFHAGGCAKWPWGLLNAGLVPLLSRSVLVVALLYLLFRLKGPHLHQSGSRVVTSTSRDRAGPKHVKKGKGDVMG